MRLAVLLLTISLTACTGAKRTHPPHEINLEDGWTKEQQTAYDKCLQDNMAVSIAWEIVEQNCRDEVEGNSDPLQQ